MHPKTLITIDYLIINLMGDLTQYTETNSEKFSLISEPYGTKTFANKFKVHYNGEVIGSLVSAPRSNIIPEQLSQMQFENHVFYSKTLEEMKQIIDEFTDLYRLEFRGVNRLDVAFDIQDKDHYYRKLQNDMSNGVTRLAGRKKSFTTYNELVKGVCINNGFALGQRSSSKLLRVYNKSLSLEINEKQHILDHYKNNNFENSDVWRFEYQLNATFFTNLRDFGHDKDFYDATKEKLTLPFQDLTYSLFDYGALIQLVIMAQNNFFVLKENTGKKQINAEQTKPFILDFDYLLNEYATYKPTILRLKSTHIPALTKKKRLAKALFREYCANFQNVSYVVALNRLLLDNNPFDNSPLIDWFDQKMKFYLAEFKEVEKMNIKFDFGLYYEQSNLFIE
jgi:hypothetical protein